MYYTNNKAEIYSFDTKSWTTVAEYPYGSYVGFAPIIHSQNSFFVLGGFTSEGVSSIIARFDMGTSSWSHAGNLKNGRLDHGAIEVESNFLTIGGYGSLPTEKCTINTNGDVVSHHWSHHWCVSTNNRI